MTFLTFEELAEPDERALLFTPFGLSMGGPVPIEYAMAHQQEATAVHLVDAVPDATRREFERLRMIHIYGLLSYDLFTIAHQHAPMVLDLALRQRFVEYYDDGGVPLVRRQQEQTRLKASPYEAVYDALNSTHRKGWKLQLAAGESMIFKGGFSHLLTWARKVGLLHGQRSRRSEEMLRRFRNLAAHPHGHWTDAPVESARMIRVSAEIINRLWGSTTPGGRLYPAPIQREIVAVGWDPGGYERIQFRAWADREVTDPEKTYVLLRAVERDPGLVAYDSRFERTRYPAELVWGPGTWQQASAFMGCMNPQRDEVDYLDRLFLVRSTDDGTTELPRRPEVALALDPDERGGTWHVIRADYPEDAFSHVRGPGGNPNPKCASEGPCDVCAVETVANGPWNVVAAQLDGIALDNAPELRVPLPWSGL